MDGSGQPHAPSVLSPGKQLPVLASYDPSKLTRMNVYCVEEKNNLLQHCLCKSH
jgi:hypothetical protein